MWRPGERRSGGCRTIPLYIAGGIEGEDSSIATAPESEDIVAANMRANG